MRARNPYDETYETRESQGFSPFGYDVALNGAQNDIKSEISLLNVILSPSTWLGTNTSEGSRIT